MFAPEPPVDDLSTSRGVVLSRAATILRSIETQPLTGGSLRLETYGGSFSPKRLGDVPGEKGARQRQPVALRMCVRSLPH